MTQPRYRSRTIKRIKKTSPGHNSKIMYNKKRPKKSVCGLTQTKLNGIHRFRQNELRSVSKSKKRPNRKFGGVYSHSAVRRALQRSIWEK